MQFPIQCNKGKEAFFDFEKDPIYEKINDHILLQSKVVDKKLIKEVWRQKERINPFFDKNILWKYKKAREICFPEDSRGSYVHSNRAGDKLCEINEFTDIFRKKNTQLRTCFDIAGGPGSWSQILLNQKKKGFVLWSGYGITMKDKTNEKDHREWYRDLVKNKRFKTLWGKDGTGNIYSHENYLSLTGVIGSGTVANASAVQDVDLAMADGGFRIVNYEHTEHLQELFTARIILSEILLAFSTLKKGGDFVCKIFDTFSDFTMTMIYFVSCSFENVSIVKPKRSRDVNSERYIIGKRYLGKNPKLILYLEKIHKNWEDNKIFKPVFCDHIFSDKVFIESYRKMTKDIVENQIQSLKKVLDMAITL